ncbi:hypothetical protein MRBLRC7O_000912 [Agrobacterium radiobacter]|uniref:hypothetical protein n=1 Tax=Agrobacterium radiobacter TaxID=362 RepID=UPI00346549D7
MSNLPPASQVVPVRRAVAITASATAFAETRGVFIETDGSFTVAFVDDAANTVTMTLVAGTVYPFSIVKCTVGTGLFAMY